MSEAQFEAAISPPASPSLGPRCRPEPPSPPAVDPSHQQETAMNGQRMGGNRTQHQKGDSQSETGGAGGPSTGGSDGDKRQGKTGGGDQKKS
jgi:hypothetical protein